MVRCEATIWKKRNKYGTTKLFPTCKKAKEWVKKMKKNKDVKEKVQIARVRPEFYKKRMLK